MKEKDVVGRPICLYNLNKELAKGVEKNDRGYHLPLRRGVFLLAEDDWGFEWEKGD